MVSDNTYIVWTHPKNGNFYRGSHLNGCMVATPLDAEGGAQSLTVIVYLTLDLSLQILNSSFIDLHKNK